jgi:signal peptidase I
MVAKGAYTDIKRPQEDDEWLHKKAYNYVKDKHKHYVRVKNRYVPSGLVSEIFDFALALLIAWLIIQGLGWALGTSMPLVVVESESMEHHGDWTQWYAEQGIDPEQYGFTGGMGIGDIIIVKGDDPKDINVGDVIVYMKYDSVFGISGEPIIHRIIGTVDVGPNSVTVDGAIAYEDSENGGKISVPCNGQNSIYPIETIKSFYQNQLVENAFPGISNELDDFRLFITKGDNAENNKEPDQCLFQTENGFYPQISYPIHERLIIGRSKFDIPYLGYVKLGLVCAFNYATGNACGSRCWWPGNHPRCK